MGTLFQAALLPGILLAVLYAVYALAFALYDPRHAPSVVLADDGPSGPPRNASETWTWFVVLPAALIGGAVLLGQAGVIGSQSLIVDRFTDAGAGASLRTNVSPQCEAAMIDLHGQAAWNAAVAEQAAIAAAGGQVASVERTAAEIAALRVEMVADAAPLSPQLVTLYLMIGLSLVVARGVAPLADPVPLVVGGVGVIAALAVDAVLIGPEMSEGTAFLLLMLPTLAGLWGLRAAAGRLATNDLLRVVFPPLVLIVAVLGSILGGITNPTPAAALGASGAIMLAAYRKLADDRRSGKMVIQASFALVIMILVGVNFDLRMGRAEVAFEEYVAFGVAQVAYHVAIFGVLYSCWVLWRGGVLAPVVRETAKVTSMVFTILIGSQILNLVVISFGGEHYIQEFLRSFDNEMVVFLIVMLVLFILGFVLDFLEIIYIVVPIVGPVIYGGTMDPKWVTIMIAVNLQTSFLTPPFGFALFYLRGVAPPSVTTAHIYTGVIPFVLIQLASLMMLWLFPGVVTIVPDLLGG